MIPADTRKDEVYDGLRADFGEVSPKASGYLSEYSFFRERALVLEAIGDASGTILDVACGGGLVTLPLAEAGRRVVGVDFNAAACRHAGRNGIEAIRGDAFNLPLADVVLNVEFVQEHEPEAVGRLPHEAARVLRPGGRLLIVWGNRRALVHRIAHPISRVMARLRGRASFARLVHHPVAGIRSAGEQAGLVADGVFAIFPPSGRRLQRADGLVASLIGSSFVAVFRKPAAP